jgi:hypothetical protein
MMCPEVSLTDALKQMASKLALTQTANKVKKFVPTGIQETAIISAGGGLFDIEEMEIDNRWVKQVVPSYELRSINLEKGSGTRLIIDWKGSNKQGKTTGAIQIFANIAWKLDNTYFSYPIYQKWPFYDRDDKQIKKGAIITNHTHVEDSGMIRTEIEKWWPPGRWHSERAGQKYDSLYTTDTGWTLKIFTPGQGKYELESDLWSFCWVDEPNANERMISGIGGRMPFGGLVIFDYTPLHAAQMSTAIDDLKRRGSKIVGLYYNMRDNSDTVGIMNSTGTKQGFMTDSEIVEYRRGTTPSEIGARVEGQDESKSGQIYSFQRDVHVTDEYDFDHPVFKSANTFVCFDPHAKYYPFISFWAITEPIFEGESKYICFNEWPNYEHFNGYYDVARETMVFKMSVVDVVKTIHVLSCLDFGFSVPRYGIDTRFAKNNMMAGSGVSAIGKVEEYAPHGIRWEMPKEAYITSGRDWLHTMLFYDKNREYSVYNCPKMIFMSHCRNMIRAFENIYWIQGGEKECERFKDPIDTARTLHGMVGSEYKYNPLVNRRLKRQADTRRVVTSIPDYNQILKELAEQAVLK